MPTRTAVTASVALAATLATGAVALATTLTGPAGSVGTDAAVRVVAPRSEAPPASGPTTLPAFDPQAVALLALAARAGDGTTPAGAPAPPVGTPDPTVTNDAGDDQGGPAPSAPRGGDDPSPTTRPNATPTVAPPTSPTTAPPFDCRGSDDGLSESVKHAREAYCHGGDD